jgi:hypothetical protein
MGNCPILSYIWNYFALLDQGGQTSVSVKILYLIHIPMKLNEAISGHGKCIKKFEYICPSGFGGMATGLIFRGPAKALQEERLYRWPAALGLWP